jgi:hypothetical protein
MAAPAEVLSSGTATLGTISHEPSSSPTVKVDDLSRKSSRDVVEITNTNRAVVRVKRVAPKLVFSFNGEINTVSGLADDGPGSVITSLANFPAPTPLYRDFDPATGVLILGDPEDKIATIEDRPMTSFDVTHYPHVAAA